MPIPVIEITPPTFAGVIVHMFGAGSEVIQPNNASADAVTIYLPARVAPNYSAPSNAMAQMDAYGPGSIEYAVLGVAASGDIETPIEIDPKTFIDNYGIIHVGPNNITNDDVARKIITFTATYRYIDPSTGEVYSQSLGNFKIVAMRSQVNNMQEDNTAIPYTQQPAFNG